ncbi:hypothetical protein LZ30DRAFT_258740 [Colletotrichum cereale]|nr:hypothetical protein LZ30DRAFT_258740 [Colletotrichum cereale]
MRLVTHLRIVRLKPGPTNLDTPHLKDRAAVGCLLPFAIFDSPQEQTWRTGYIPPCYASSRATKSGTYALTGKLHSNQTMGMGLVASEVSHHLRLAGTSPGDPLRRSVRDPDSRPWQRPKRTFNLLVRHLSRGRFLCQCCDWGLLFLAQYMLARSVPFDVMEEAGEAGSKPAWKLYLGLLSVRQLLFVGTPHPDAGCAMTAAMAKDRSSAPRRNPPYATEYCLRRDNQVSLMPVYGWFPCPPSLRAENEAPYGG